MDTVYYNKLVRDNIPDIIRSTGHIPNCVVSDDIIHHLKMKLDEETAEFDEVYKYVSSLDVDRRKDKGHLIVEKLVDVVEVCRSMADELGFPQVDFCNCVEEKKARRGAFDKKIVLVSVDSVDTKTT